MLCWCCGAKSVRALKPDGIRYGNFHGGNVPRQFCEKCYQKEIAKRERLKAEYNRLRALNMFNSAIECLETQPIDLYEYKDIIEQMESYVQERPDKFGSSDEIMAAIALIGFGMKIKAQYEVMRYKIDFLIPEYHVALEIDGIWHKNKKNKDLQRDVNIRQCLGPEWEVVRIPTSMVRTDASAIPIAVIQMYDELKQLRKDHDGIVPSWYSDRHSSVVEKKRNKEYIVLDD